MNQYSRKHVSRFSVDTGGLTPRVSRIGGIQTAYPPEPQVWYTPEVAAQITYLVDKCTKEVGWFGLVRYHEAEHAYEIYKISIPNQIVTATETDIDEKSWGEAGHELILQGYDTTDMYAWFHSHVNMSVSPSLQDEDQVEEFIEALVDTPEMPVFIRGIINKKGEYKVDVYYIQHGIAYNCVPVMINDPQRRTFVEGMDALIKDRVVEKTYIPPAYPYNYKVPAVTVTNTPATNKTTQPSLVFENEEEEEETVIFDALGNIINDTFDDDDVYEQAVQMVLDSGKDVNDEDFEDEVEQMMVDLYQQEEAWRQTIGFAYGEDWDENTPVRNRPEGWEADLEYQRVGKYLDHYATAT